jgi:hypothetical protein
MERLLPTTKTIPLLLRKSIVYCYINYCHCLRQKALADKRLDPRPPLAEGNPEKAACLDSPNSPNLFTSLEREFLYGVYAARSGNLPAGRQARPTFRSIGFGEVFRRGGVIPPEYDDGLRSKDMGRENHASTLEKIAPNFKF